MLRAIVTTVVAVGVALAMPLPATAYDRVLAESYAQLFEPVQGAQAGKHLNLIKPEGFVAKVRAGQKIVGLDVRTEAEAEIFTTTLPGSLTIPLHELFLAENLDRIPTDHAVVVICKSGTRATAAGTALRHVGFKDVYILKGGLKALSNYLDAKTANAPLGSKHAGLQ